MLFHLSFYKLRKQDINTYPRQKLRRQIVQPAVSTGALRTASALSRCTPSNAYTF